MASLTKILVAGGGAAFVELQNAFSPSHYVLRYADNAAEVPQHAVGSSVIIIDGTLLGSGLELCQRLRSDPATRLIPLVLRVANIKDHPQAAVDVRVTTSDLMGLVEKVAQLVGLPPSPSGRPTNQHPSPDVPPATPSDTFHHLEQEQQEQQDWPPLPPTLLPEEDLVEFSHDFSGYMNSLIQAMETPSKLSSMIGLRLKEVSQVTMSQVEEHLETIQAVINEALMAKDIPRMKTLSAAKNSLYDKLHRMRSLQANLEDVSFEEVENVAQSAAILSPHAGTSAPQKSALSRAAAAKARQRPATRQRAVKASIKPPMGQGAALERRLTSILPPWLWVLLAVSALGVVAIVYIATFYQRSAHAPKTSRQNTPPVMKYVFLEQTRAGIFARPQAEDKERDRISFSFLWRINGRDKPAYGSARLAPDKYRLGDTVQVRVIPSDGYASGSPHFSKTITTTALKKKPPAPPLPPATK